MRVLLSMTVSFIKPAKSLMVEMTRMLAAAVRNVFHNISLKFRFCTEPISSLKNNMVPMRKILIDTDLKMTGIKKLTWLLTPNKHTVSNIAADIHAIKDNRM
jgi:hypothetical protein